MAHRGLSSLHMHCIAPVVNLGVKECKTFVQKQISKIKTNLIYLRCSLMRRDVFLRDLHRAGTTCLTSEFGY